MLKLATCEANDFAATGRSTSGRSSPRFRASKRTSTMTASGWSTQSRRNVSVYLTVFTRGTPGPRNGSVRLRTRLVVVLPNSASSSTISSRWAIDVAATFMT